MTRPRLLMTTDAVGGVWSYSTDLAQQLCASGWTVALVTQGPKPSAAQLAPLRDVNGLDVIPTELALEWLDPSGSDIPRAQQRLQEIARDFKPDLVHLNSYREAAFAWNVPVLVTAHSCVWSWWEACRGGVPHETRWQTYRANVAAGLAAADAWVAPTRAFAHALERIYRPAPRGIVIHNGVAIPGAPARAPTEKAESILAAGRLWDEAKNIAALANVAARIAWPIRVAGPLQAPDASAAHGYVSTVEFIGTLSRPVLAAEMARAGIFVSLARYEPFGLTVLEAASQGCALVLSDICTLRELWNNAAVFVDPDDDEAICSSINALCRDETGRAQLQQAARIRAGRYTLQTQARAYEQLYAEMLSCTGAKRSAQAMELCA